MFMTFTPMFTSAPTRKPTLRHVALERARHMVGCRDCKNHYLGRTPKLTLT